MIKEFKLGSTTWTVEKAKKFQNENVLAYESFAERKITLSKTHGNLKVSKSSMDQSLYHEVVHAILDTMGEDGLSHDEKFVQGFSVLMQQFEQTKK